MANRTEFFLEFGVQYDSDRIEGRDCNGSAIIGL